MFKSFLELFTKANILFYILFAITMVLLIFTEIFSKNKVFKYLSYTSLALTIIVRYFIQKPTFGEFILYCLWLAVFMALIVAISAIIKAMILVSKRKRINKLKIPTTEQGNYDYSFLLNKQGVVVADLKPSGKVKIEGKIYDVSCVKKYLYAGTKVYVSKVETSRIYVKQIKAKEKKDV